MTREIGVLESSNNLRVPRSASRHACSLKVPSFIEGVTATELLEQLAHADRREPKSLSSWGWAPSVHPNLSRDFYTDEVEMFTTQCREL